MMESAEIVKSSGEHVAFRRDKLIGSLQRSGASNELIDQIVGQVEKELYNGITTKEIYNMAFDLLRRREGSIAGKYKLKRAIMELGPSGFPFEKYIAAIFREEGYKVATNIIVDGKCVKHEMDVIAENETQQLIIECKFHSLGASLCDVKVPLYIHSRFRDVESVRIHREAKGKELSGWLVTNTHFTGDALQYGNCVGLNLMGWSYPEHASLRSKIDSGRLYPITCLTTISNSEKQKILEEGIVLCKQLLASGDLLNKIGLSTLRKKKVLRELDNLCNHLGLN